MSNETKDEKQTLEFRYITGLDRLEDIKQLFFEYAESLPIDLAFQDFEAELIGIGKRLITMAIEEATKLGYGFMRLDTLPSMKEAQDLYTSFGFCDIDPYVYNPIHGTRFMELKL